MAEPRDSYSPALKLILGGARLAPSEQVRTQLKDALASGIDWDRLFKLGLYHQVLPLVISHVRALGVTLPEEVADTFSVYSRRVALQNLMLVEQLKVVHELLEQASVPVIHFKGPTLAAQAYQNLGLRICSDLDLLVRPQDLARVGGVVTGNGFMPGSKLQQWYGFKRRIFLYLSQQATFVHRGNHIHLDVHIGLAPPLYPYPTHFEVLQERGRDLNIGGKMLRTFSAEDALVLLCLHGEKNRWEFLKYVTDISALLESHPALDWDVVERIAEETHTHRITYLGLALASSLLDAPIPEVVAKRLTQDASVQELKETVIARISAMDMQISDFEKRFWLHLHTQDRLRDRLRYLGVAALRWAWDRYDHPQRGVAAAAQ